MNSRAQERLMWVAALITLAGAALVLPMRSLSPKFMVPMAIVAALPMIALHLYYIFSGKRFERAMLILFAGAFGIGGSLGFLSMMFLRRRPHVVDSALMWGLFGAVGLIVSFFLLNAISKAEEEMESRDIEENAKSVMLRKVRPIRTSNENWSTEWSHERTDWRLTGTDLFFADIVTGLQAGMNIDEIASLHTVDPAHVGAVIGDMHSVMFEYRTRMEEVTQNLQESVDAIEGTLNQGNRKHLIGIGLIFLSILFFVLFVINR